MEEITITELRGVLACASEAVPYDNMTPRRELMFRHLRAMGLLRTDVWGLTEAGARYLAM